MIAGILEIFILLTIIDAIVSFVPEPKVRTHPVVLQLKKIVDIPQKPIRKLMPPNIPFDPSPLIVILVLRMIISFI
jgi:YggT family protein